METLEFVLEGNPRGPLRSRAIVRGVVCSGGLEVLIEPANLSGRCRFEVITSAEGFGEIWKAVLSNALARWPVANISIAINDAGATPAIVSLRLDQALAAYLGVDS